MSKLLRYFAPGQFCFITAVTFCRERILHQHADLLIRAVRRARMKSPFSVIAWAILPDHFHAVIKSPRGDADKITQRVKLSFSLQWQRASGRSGPIWQHRYWDHIIRSEEDMKRHVDYIHYNPVKHGLVASPGAWPLSSYHRYLRQGYYEADWGNSRLEFGDGVFGE